MNPGIKTEANQKQKPFTMNEKPPKLKIFRGMDKVDKIGLIKALTPPIADAAIKAATKVDKFTPGTTKSTTNKLRAVATNVNNDAIINFASDCIAVLKCIFV